MGSRKGSSPFVRSRPTLQMVGWLGCVLAAVPLPGSATAQTCEGPRTEYEVRFVAPDIFQVEATFAQPAHRLDLNFFPAAGRPEGQAESISSLRGWGHAGEQVDIDYAGRAGWTVPEQAGVSRIRYTVRADHDETTWGDGGPDEVAARFDDVYFFVGHAFFLIDHSWPPCPVQVSFRLPEDWTSMAPWSRDGSSYVASEPMTLWSNAFALGRFSPRRTMAGSMALDWVMDSDLKPIEGRLSELLDRLPRVFVDYFGGAPSDAYSVVVFGDSFTDGGAFRQSFALRVGVPVRSAEQAIWSHVLGHEILHLWLGNYVRGERPTELYWFTEGFTDYLTVKLMYQAGLLSDDMVRQRLATIVRRYRVGRKLSPGVSLVDAGRAKTANWELIYGGGALIALLLDAELSAGDGPGLQAALGDLYRGGEEPYSGAGLMRALDRSTGGAASRVFDAVDRGIPFPVLARGLQVGGLDVVGFTADEVYVFFSDACGESRCVPPFLVR